MGKQKKQAQTEETTTTATASKSASKKKTSGSEAIAILIFATAVLWGIWQKVNTWMLENPQTVLNIQWTLWILCLLIVIGFFVMLVAALWGNKRLKMPTVGSESATGGWTPDQRRTFAVVPAATTGRRSFPMGGMGGGRRGSGMGQAFEPWATFLRHSGELPQSKQINRCMIARHEGDVVWGVSVDKSIGQIASRSAESQWKETKVENWPLREADEISDNLLPDQPGGGAVVRRYLEPQRPELPLHTAEEEPDHPLSRLIDVLNDYPNVDAQIRIDVIPVSPSRRSKTCSDNLKILGEEHPHEALWTDEKNLPQVQGVRVLLRVARGGPGQAAKCEQAAQRLVHVLETSWATEDNRFVVRNMTDNLFDQIWTHGVLERNYPIYHFDCLKALMSPPSGKARQGSKQTTAKRLPDPPVLETFDPVDPESLRRLMPIGVLTEEGHERMVGVPWGGATDALFDWTVGATGSGKTWHALSRVVALAETGRGFLFLDPHRTAVQDIKRYVGARHSNRILEIDMQAANELHEPISAGWNPLDLTVVPARLRKGRIDNLKGSLPPALFPDYFGGDSKSAPRTGTIVSKALEVLLELNFRLPPEIQANLFCLGNLLMDDEWRDLAVDVLPVRDQLWWHTTFPGIVGQKGAESSALTPTINSLEKWKSQNRMQALLGASISTLRWRDIMEKEQILFVVLNNDGSETDNLLSRLIVQEMVSAFKERSFNYQADKIKPFHLFLDEFQSYANVIEHQAETFLQELRKFGAKVHFLNQAPSALKDGMKQAIVANRTHLFSGSLGTPKDAKFMAEAMGGQAGGPQSFGSPEGGGAADTRVGPEDLQGLKKWHFIAQVTLGSAKSSAFEIRGINAEVLWAKLLSDEDISEQVAINTGLLSVAERLDHYDTLPVRIAHWLKTEKILPVEQVLAQQRSAYEESRNKKIRDKEEMAKQQEAIQKQQSEDFPTPQVPPPELDGQSTLSEAGSEDWSETLGDRPGTAAGS